MPVHDGMLSWPSDPDVSLQPFKTAADKGSNVSVLSSSTHLGTHVDAPRHFLDEAGGVDQIPLESLLGQVHVLDLTAIDSPEILPEHLESIPKATERVIFKTANTTKRLLEQPFTEDYVGLSADGAKWLTARGIKLVGIDYLSIQRRGPDSTPHTELLKHGVVIIEGLVLQDVPAGDYELFCLPIKIKDGDGAPARVVLKSLE